MGKKRSKRTERNSSFFSLVEGEREKLPEEFEKRGYLKGNRRGGPMALHVNRTANEKRKREKGRDLCWHICLVRNRKTGETQRHIDHKRP